MDNVFTVREVTEEEHTQSVAQLTSQCVEVRFTVHKPPKTRSVKGAAADRIAQFVGGSKKGVSTSKKMFSSSHEAVKELNKSISNLEALRDQRTIVKSADLGNGQTANKVESGVRLLLADEAVTFYQEFRIRSAQVDFCARRVAEELESIKELDKAAAGTLYDESDYPADIANRIGVAKSADGMPIVEFGPPRDYSILPKELAAQMQAMVMTKMDATVEAAVGNVCNVLNEQLLTLLQQLNNRVRIDPVPAHPWAKYCNIDQAEVLKQEVHRDNPSVPDGSVRVYLSFKSRTTTQEEGGEVETDSTTMVWLDAIPLDEYQRQVRPKATGERRKVYASVIENVLNQVRSIRDYKANMLGAHGENLSGSVGDLLATLEELQGINQSRTDLAESTAKEIRNSETFSRRLQDTIVRTVENMKQTTEQVNIVRQRTILKRNPGVHTEI